MSRRSKKTPVYGLLVGGSNCFTALYYDWHLLGLVAIASVTMVLGVHATRLSRTPEVPAAVCFLLLQLNQVTAVALTGGVHSPVLVLTLVPLFTQAVCFRPRVSAAATGCTAVMAIGASVAAAALPSPEAGPLSLSMVAYLAVLVSLGMAAHDLADSDAHARGTASVDALTGLFSRRALSSHFSDVRARAGTSPIPVGVTLLDIDHFKDVNDTFGHERGDEVLQEVARRLTAAARAEDLIYRVGGEEFVVVSPGADAAMSHDIAERLRMAVRSGDICGVPVSASAGTCSRSTAEAHLTEMLRDADGALYAAKRGGRDRVVVAAPTT